MEALSLWRPFRDLERLARSWESRFPRFSQEFEEAEKEFAPPVECYVKDGSLVVRADVPGLEPKDIEINVLENVLTIKGERKSEQEIKKENYLRREVSYGAFERRMNLPEGAMTDKVKAIFKNGVVEVTVPLAKEVGAKDTARGRVREQNLTPKDAELGGCALITMILTQRGPTAVTLKDLMTTEVKCHAASSTLNTVAQMMWDDDIGCVPVVDQDGRVIVMLTDRDVCMAAYTQGLPLTGSLVTSAMSKEVFSSTPNRDIGDAEKLMRETQIRRLGKLCTGLNGAAI